MSDAKLRGTDYGFGGLFVCFTKGYHSLFSRPTCLLSVPSKQQVLRRCSDFLGLEHFSTVFCFLFFWLCWVFVSVRGLSPVVASGGHSSSRCAGLSLSQPLLLRSTGSRRAGSVAVAHGPSRSAARGILPNQGSNPCPLH